MTDSINAVNSTSAASSASSTSNKLTAATKAQLEALGVDTTYIKTESDGQIALKQAQASQTQKAQANGGSSASKESIKAQIQSLASQVGVSVSQTDKPEDILTKISEKISSLRAEAGNDQSKLAQIEQYQQQYESLSGQMLSMQTSQAQLAASMSGLANYNKALI